MNRKESLRTGAKYFESFKHKTPTWLGRLIAVTLIASISSERYHSESSVDKTPNNPANTLFLKSLIREESQIFFGQKFEEKKVVKIQQPLTPQELELGKRERETEGILRKILENQKIFFEDDFEDIEMYYPIYAAAAEKFDIPWYLLWMIHKAESTVSKNPNAFFPELPHYGAMGRALAFHFQANVDYASRGLEFLANLPQRHPDDWAEIAWAAMKLAEDWDTTGSLLGTLTRYTSVVGPAYHQKFLTYQKVFQ